MKKFIELIDRISKRPDMFVGSGSLRDVSRYLSGYTHAYHQLKKKDFFDAWTAWIEVKFKLSNPAWHWTRIMVHHYGNDQKACEALPKLYRQYLLDYRKIGPLGIQKKWNRIFISPEALDKDSMPELVIDEQKFVERLEEISKRPVKYRGRQLIRKEYDYNKMRMDTLREDDPLSGWLMWIELKFKESDFIYSWTNMLVDDFSGFGRYRKVFNSLPKLYRQFVADRKKLGLSGLRDQWKTQFLFPRKNKKKGYQ